MTALVYATRSDMYAYAITADALTGVATGDQDSALNTASRLADSYLTNRFVLPLAVWGEDLRLQVANIAAFLLMRSRGFSPQQGDAEQLRAGYEDAMDWLKAVAAGKVTPTNVTDASAAGVDNTDASGEARDVPSVVQPYSESNSAGGFWNNSDSVTGGGVGAPRKRGW